MPIDRRITNGLAWAGALVVVAIPAADAALRQFGPQSTPQVAVIEAQPDVPVLPTPASQRPTEVAVAEEPNVSEPVVETAALPVAKPAAKPVTTPASDPVTTASANPASGDAVDDFLKSGRPLPSYITGGGPTAPAQTAAVAPAAPTRPAPAPVVSAPAAEQVAAVPRTRIVTFPTPVSERPTTMPQGPVIAAQPPLVIETQPSVVTASDLEDWESGPLSEFLASRQRGSGDATEGFETEGFFLDEAPSSNARVWRFPRAYDGDYYPFE